MDYISVRNISKDFKGVNALKTLNFDINKGEFISLLGPSGCGKSTLLRIIAGLETSTSGEIFLNGENIINTPVNKRNLGMVFQSYSLFPNMTAEENVAFGLKLKKMPYEEIQQKVSEMFQLVGLTDKLKAYPYELSGGQQQRVALARALITSPNVLLLDEPLSALDAKIRLSLRNLIKNIQEKLKITTIFVTHDQEEALSISDRIFVMENGNIVQSGTPEEIYKRPKTRFVASFLGTYNFLTSDLFNEAGSNREILVRPEHFNIIEGNTTENSNAILKGIVNNVYFLGNIIRIEVKVNDTMVLVDVLNKDDSYYTLGQEIYLSLPKDKIINIL